MAPDQIAANERLLRCEKSSEGLARSGVCSIRHYSIHPYEFLAQEPFSATKRLTAGWPSPWARSVTLLMMHVENVLNFEGSNPQQARTSVCHYLMVVIDGAWWVDCEGRPFGPMNSKEELSLLQHT
jgi:hypothetical protein